MKQAVLAAVILSLGTSFVPAQEPGNALQSPTVTLTIEEIARLAQSRNLEIFKAARSVERARKDLIGEPELMDSELTASGGYTSGGSGGGWSGQSSVSLPLFPQLSVGGEVSVADQWQLGEELSLSLKPLIPSRQTYSEEKVLNSSAVHERYLRRRIYLDAERAALNLLIREMERQLARSTEELQGRNYELSRRREELGEVSFQDVQDQLIDLIAARQSLFSSEQRYLSDWRTLQLLFAPSEERIGVAPLSVSELLERLQARREQAQGFADTSPITENLEILRLELTALQAELKATPLWRPDLSLSAALALPGVSPSASLSLGFSPSQIKREERKELQEDIEVKGMEIAAESYAAALQKSLAQQNLDLVEEALASAQIQEQRDRIALQEGELLFGQGRRTSLELEQLRLNLRRTQILVFQSTAEVYRVLGEYLFLFVSEESE